MAPEPAAVPSPQFQLYELIVPSVSCDPEASTDTFRSATVEVNDATGAWFGTAFTVVVDVSVSPASSVTVSVTVYVPPVAYVWLAVLPEPAAVPSPQFQL